MEDDDAAFRFNYSSDFLKWYTVTTMGFHIDMLAQGIEAPRAPQGLAYRGPRGFEQEARCIYIRRSYNATCASKVSYDRRRITSLTLHSTISATEINYLCVHKKLRSKRLAPVLIKEVTRQVHLKGIFQAIYTAGIVIPTPVSVCR